MYALHDHVLMKKNHMHVASMIGRSFAWAWISKSNAAAVVTL